MNTACIAITSSVHCQHKGKRIFSFRTLNKRHCIKKKNQISHKLSDECSEVSKAFPGRLVRVFGVPGGCFEVSRDVLGVLMGVSML